MRALVAEVVKRVVDGQHQRVATQERQREVEPEVALLYVQHVRIEPPDARQVGADHPDLPERLAQARLAERVEADGRVELRPVAGQLALREQQRDVGPLGHRAGQPDAVLAEVEGEYRRLHRVCSDQRCT